MKTRKHIIATITIITLFATLSLFAGCETLRPQPDETQKQNAWLHRQTCTLAASTATDENASAKLTALTGLSAKQSGAWSVYCGPPEILPPHNTAEDILSAENYTLAEKAAENAEIRIEPTDYVLGILDIAAAVAAVIGGAAGLKIVTAVSTARQKAAAIREIITGNEIFKTSNPDHAQKFKDAHNLQSPGTRTIVTQIKAQVNSGANRIAD